MRTLTQGEIAQYSDVPLRTVTHWMEKGEIKPFRLSGKGKNCIQVDDFVRILNTFKVPVSTELDQGPKRVLVLDDEVLMAEAIARALRRDNYQVELAFHGFQAGKMLASFRPDIMTLDLRMIGVDGFEILRCLRRKEKYNYIKCLVISALSRSDLEKALALGADDFLEKPFSNKVLLQKLAQMIRR